MEETIKILIYIHAFFGGVGLITGIGSVIVKKGSLAHKRMGKLFSIGMIISSLVSMPVAWMPNHENLFLFLIGIFTIYLVLTGNRALKFITTQQAQWVDKVVSGAMFSFSIIMITIGVYSLLNNLSIGVLYLIFGSIGFFLAINDFRFYKNIKTAGNRLLMAHISKMVGALIASVTAFIVAGLGIGSIIGWLLPTILGTIYIAHWRKKTVTNNLHSA